MGVPWSRLMRLWWGDSRAQDDTSGAAPPAAQEDIAKEKEPASVPCTMELRLMLEADSTARHPSVPSIEVDGKRWVLSEPLDVDSDALPPYICVSYVWGSGRVPNVLYPSITMSDRTLSTFAAAARCMPGRPIWIDAFCVPTERAKKRATLESLGFLFARAAAVVSVIAPESLAAVEEMEAFLAIQPRPQTTPAAPLDVLEADEWIRSVWTYQELVNSRELWFVCPTQEGVPPQKSFSGSDFLGVIGGYVDCWGRTDKQKLHTGVRQFYPHADNFQELLADWLTSDYGRRSALRIICGMDYRAHVTPQNRFYSMIGALTARPSTRATNPTVEQLAERFMELAEEKGDYSFMFTTAARDTRPGLRWRPVPSDLQSVLTWHAFGDEQPGTKVDDGILLTDVLLFPLAGGGQDSATTPRMGQELRDHIQLWEKHVAEYHDVAEDDPNATLQERGLHILRRMGFAGSGKWHTTEGCVFYPQTDLPEGDGTICVSHGVRWVFGGPAIAVLGSGRELQYVPGVAVMPMDYRTQTTQFLLK